MPIATTAQPAKLPVTPQAPPPIWNARNSWKSDNGTTRGTITKHIISDSVRDRWSVDGNTVSPAKATAGMYEILPRRAGKHGRNEDEYGCSVNRAAEHAVSWRMR
jgi:hypothetical protein